ncbi:hypothetical protein JAAARDRAFT_136561, partial [Jaapia argillacea MUCL 33604]
AFLWFEEKIVFLQNVEDFMHYFPMFLQRVSENEDVFIHHSLESSWQIGETKEHDHRLE